MIITPPFGSPQVTPVDGNDPLLVAGAPVTLIGWADQPMDVANGVTINGASSGGTHDSLIQMPLNIDLIGSSNLPPGVITGQVINAQGDKVQTTSPNVYTMNTGSITFEYTLPEASSLQANSLTIAEPVIAQAAGMSQLQVRLYNWNTHSWDTITLNNNSFTTTNTKAYTSFDRHILLQVVNQNASLGVFLFGKPSLSLNDAVN